MLSQPAKKHYYDHLKAQCPNSNYSKSTYYCEEAIMLYLPLTTPQSYFDNSKSIDYEISTLKNDIFGQSTESNTNYKEFSTSYCKHKSAACRD